ncbi:MAG: putative DNA binding domain-containing protein [Oscillospiraceae bacterium]|nr:putative DNA binding domain-containing protein [Oscillospiraceae bacterium]
MMPVELENLIDYVQGLKAETQTLELKAAVQGCPTRLYDTLSSFSNQDEGGTILFGVDEQKGFIPVGVYDAQDLMKRVTEQCNQMTPAVRPVFTTLLKDEKAFVSAEIPGIDVTDRPCFYAGKGRLRGAYVRVGDSDQPMTEYEIYSYEAFRRKYQDDIRPVEQSGWNTLNKDGLDRYLSKLKTGRPNLSKLKTEEIFELVGITREGIPTLAAVLLFSLFPQGYFPQLCITAVSVPGSKVGQLGPDGERFLDNQRIEGTLSEMLEGALAFVRKNTRTKTIIDPETGKRADREDYPLTAVREAILNALIHRDYSLHTEGMPIQILLFEDRLEVRSPGGLYGRLRIDQLGKVQPDTRNPVLAVAMEVLGETENRYSGIPTMRRELVRAGMPEPEFQDERGTFVVCFRQETETSKIDSAALEYTAEEKLLHFCAVPRSRQEIAKFLNIKSVAYAVTTYVTPLVEKGLLTLSLPDRPRSPKQRYTAAGK